MKIKQMPKHMASLIAAGEVVERPASVVKELCENSVDAGATSLTVEIKGGGKTYIRISDNGSGIFKEDLPLAFKPHATSKVETEKDLESISTLGFRGEALSSICAVSETEVLTLSEGEEIGSSYKIAGGEEISLESAGCPKGTTIIVRNLFYNTPARMKFLKSDTSEGNYVSAVVDRIALSHPEISIRFIREGKQIFNTAGDGNLYNSIYAVFGADFAKSLMKVDYELGGIRVHGFISKPLNCRANRSMQYFFVSGRQVKSLTAMTALENAYKNSVMVGKVPACVLHIELSPELVDVNVHPAKTEVRFANDKAVFDAVYYACKNSLMSEDTPKEIKLTFDDVARKPKVEQQSFENIKPAPKTENFWQKTGVEQYKAEPEPFLPQSFNAPKADYTATKSKRIDIEFEDEDLITESNAEPEKAAIIKEENPVLPEAEELSKPEPFKVIGEVFKTYIIVEQGNEVIFIDKHAAHERMIFEQLKQQEHNQSQMLLTPVNVTLAKEDYDALIANTENLKKSGFIIEDFGSGTARVRGYPLVLENTDIASTIEETAGYLRENRREFSTETLDWLYHNIACRAAVKAGNYTSEFEMKKFVETLLSKPFIRYCPHGRPVAVIMSKYEFEKQFGRA